MEIDRSAPALAEGVTTIEAQPEIVWSVLADLPGWPAWNHDVRSVTLEGPLEPGSTFRWKAGRSSLVSRLEVVDPPREIGWTGVTMGIHAVHVFRFEPSEDGTLARSEESWRGLIPSIFRGFSRRTLQRGIDGILASLKAEAERRAPA